ncbi:hypothetical protein [Enterococcus faecium]|uniref:hypothetical protein n=1 Tax=Enterococcus faecium TaxID=1352 RepID=UPI000BEFE6AA|nr:hypothetical protein [Enterococcus faecium]PEH49323.1 hypothetical protein CRM75_16225 [Enterococcus faecium]
MKIKDGFYTSAYGIGGLMVDLPTKNPKEKKKVKVKVGDMVRCEAEEFLSPFRGYIEKISDNSAIIKIENTMECDLETARHKDYMAVARLSDIEILETK